MDKLVHNKQHTLKTLGLLFEKKHALSRALVVSKSTNGFGKLLFSSNREDKQKWVRLQTPSKSFLTSFLNRTVVNAQEALLKIPCAAILNSNAQLLLKK